MLQYNAEEQNSQTIGVDSFDTPPKPLRDPCENRIENMKESFVGLWLKRKRGIDVAVVRVNMDFCRG